MFPVVCAALFVSVGFLNPLSSLLGIKYILSGTFTAAGIKDLHTLANGLTLPPNDD